MFTLEDVTNRTPEAHEFVMQRVASANMGWFEPFEEDKPTVLYGFHGGAEWTGAAFNPSKNHLYVSSNHVPWIVTVFQPDRVTRDPSLPPTKGEMIYRETCAQCHGPDRFGVGMYPPLQGLGRRLNDSAVRTLLATGKNAMPAAPETLTSNASDMSALLDYLFLRDLPPGSLKENDSPLRYTHNGYPKLVDDEGYPGCKPPWGTLNCIDLSTGKLIWQVPLGVYPDLEIWGEDNTGAENFGGPTATAGGLVFCAGAADERIRAFDADTGAKLWEHPLPFGGFAPPTVYELEGKQYVVIAATGGGKLGTKKGDAYIAFSLP